MAWKTVEIGSFLKERGDRFKPKEANTLDLKRIKKIDFQGKIHVIDHKPTKTNMILVKKGDLVISGINVEKGALAVYEEDEDTLATIHYSSYEYDKNQVDIEYLKWFLKSRTFQDIVKEQAGGGIKTELKPKRFLPLKIKLPGLDEQIDIARKIDSVAAEIDDLSETNNYNQTLLIQLHQAILQKAVQGKLVEQDPNDEPASELLKRIKAEKEKLIAEGKIRKQKPLSPITENEIPYELPQGWEWSKINDLCFVTKLAGFEYTKYINFRDQGEVPVVRAQNVKKNKVDEKNLLYIDLEISKMLERSALSKKAILMTFIGAGIGDVAVFDKKKRWHLAPNVAKLEPYDDKGHLITIEYLLYYLLSKTGQNEIFKFNKATAQPSLSMGTIREVLVPILPINEQNRIVKKVDQLMHLCDELETRLNQSKKYSEMLMQAVLHEAFS